jgi:hypothetical protein
VKLNEKNPRLILCSKLGLSVNLNLKFVRYFQVVNKITGLNNLQVLTRICWFKQEFAGLNKNLQVLIRIYRFKQNSTIFNKSK